ncbi:MAG: Flp pilus assembly protein CpaB [Planctomycetota bacterium]|nr:MAG: Flp pilus assembly protein CpaB [Planctomycetota bacterium]
MHGARQGAVLRCPADREQREAQNSMKPKTIIPLIIGLAVGFFAIKMGVDMVQKARGAQGGEALVCVTAKQIEVATRLTEGMIATTRIPSALVPSNAFTDPKALIGRVTTMTMAPGVPITNGMLAPPGAEPGLRAIIPSGHRAVSVSVTEESAVAGFITPGSRVDVSTVSEREGTSKLILTDVEVGAVGQSLSEVSSDGKTTRVTKSVTLFLEQHEVQILNAHTAGRSNKVRLALRGNATDPGESFWSRMFKNAGTAPEKESDPQEKAPAPQYVVEVLHGTELERLVFDDSGLVERSSAQGTRSARGRVAAGAAATEQPTAAPSEDVE